MAPSHAKASARASSKRSTGVRTGWVLSREMHYIRAPTPLSEAEGNTSGIATARCNSDLRGRRPHARTESFRARTGRSACRSARQRAGPRREGAEPKPTMDDMQKSDGPVVPTKSPNKTAQAEAEG